MAAITRHRSRTRTREYSLKGAYGNRNDNGTKSEESEIFESSCFANVMWNLTQITFVCSSSQ
ncbi:hypothetical protein Ahy_A08g039639 isoform C [Arachis hypogaea]|uniref:Uncharacterized protein n=1 Tax=Arachis hypogaea TaxID=3818 RepID=A0A445BX41_ARAHY|nr:hypothetical protein Ahy_A08g039639 isoform C [Arachis hypogaea]